MALNREEVLEKIKEVLEKDLTAADLKLSLFISAAISYKKDFLLNPFPNNLYVEQEEKNFDKLVR
jgi:poly [ADP-ribose] polymerase 16